MYKHLSATFASHLLIHPVTRCVIIWAQLCPSFTNTSSDKMYYHLSTTLPPQLSSEHPDLAKAKEEPLTRSKMLSAELFWRPLTMMVMMMMMMMMTLASLWDPGSGIWDLHIIIITINSIYTNSRSTAPSGRYVSSSSSCLLYTSDAADE